MELTIQVNPVERTVRLREVRALAAGDSCSVVLEGVRGADVSALRLALYRDAASDSPVASCPSFAPVRGHPNLATGDLRLDTAEMAAWFEAVRPEPEGSTTDKDGPRSGDTAERAVRTDGWLVVSEPTRTWAACRVPVVLRPGAGVSGVVDPTSIQSLVEGLVSAAMSEALASKADKATTLAGYGITDAATKTELNAKADKSALAAKADKATTLAGYGITDAAIKSELESVSHTAGGAMSLATETHTALSSKADLVDGKVPADQLPSYVDDVLEYDSVSAFPSTGEDGKIYVAKDTNKTYRWGGTQYVEISQSLALGETAETAYPGDKGKAAAEKADAAYSAAESLADGVNSLAGTIGTHIRDTNNPHAVTAAQVGTYTTGEIDGKLAAKADEFTPWMFAGETAGYDNLSVVIESVYEGAAFDYKLYSGGTFIAGFTDSSDSLTVAYFITIDATKRITATRKRILYTGGSVSIGESTGGGGTIEVTGSGASIKKDGKEVATEESLAPEYSPSSAYAVGSFVYHDGNIYQCKTAIADGGEAWNAAHWELRKLDDFFTEANGLLTSTIEEKSIPAFSSSSTYEVGEVVIYDGVAYKCVTAITTVEEWTAAHWTLATNSDLAARIKGLKSDGTATDAFATGLLGKPIAKEAIDEEIIEKGTAPDAHLEAPTDERLKLILADNSVAYDSAKALPYKLTSVIGDRVVATMTLTAASTDITLPAIAANDTTVKDFILDVTNAYAVEGVATDAGINIPRTDFKLVTRDGESLTDVTTVKAGKSAFICFTQKSPVVVDGTTYPCWCVIQLPFGDPS